MLDNGKYSVWFKTPLGEGTGVVILEDGNISGGDTIIEYSGSYSQSGDEFSADVSMKRHTPGQLSVFGIDDVDIVLTGKSTGKVASCRGRSRRAPGMKFEATMIRTLD